MSVLMLLVKCFWFHWGSCLAPRRWQVIHTSFTYVEFDTAVITEQPRYLLNSVCLFVCLSVRLSVCLSVHDSRKKLVSRSNVAKYLCKMHGKVEMGMFKPESQKLTKIRHSSHFQCSYNCSLNTLNTLIAHHFCGWGQRSRSRSRGLTELSYTQCAITD